MTDQELNERLKDYLPKEPAPCPYCNSDPQVGISQIRTVFCRGCSNQMYFNVWNSYLLNDLGFLLGVVEKEGYFWSLSKHATLKGNFYLFNLISLHSKEVDSRKDYAGNNPLKAVRQALKGILEEK